MFAGRTSRGKKPADPYLYAMRLLARREYSRQQIETKLHSKGFAEAQIKACIAELQAADYLNDLRFAQAFARVRANSGYGPRRIAMDLQNAGIDDALLEAALEASETDFGESAASIMARRYSAEQLSDQAAYIKAVSFLLRRGFTHEQAYGAAKRLKSA